MKKQYVIAMLLLIGFGVVSTMAFTLDANLNVGTKVYDIQETGSEATITKVKVRPFKDLDSMRIKVTITPPATAAYNMTVTTDVDFTGCTITDSETSYLAADSDLANGYLVFNNIGTAVTSVTVTITGYTPDPENLWEDMTSLILSVSDI